MPGENPGKKGNKMKYIETPNKDILKIEAISCHGYFKACNYWGNSYRINIKRLMLGLREKRYNIINEGGYIRNDGVHPLCFKCENQYRSDFEWNQT